MLLLWIRRDRVRAMAMRSYSTFPKAPVLRELHHQIVSGHIQAIHWGGVSHLSRDAVSEFYSLFSRLSQLGWIELGEKEGDQWLYYMTMHIFMLQIWHCTWSCSYAMFFMHHIIQNIISFIFYISVIGNYKYARYERIY